MGLMGLMGPRMLTYHIGCRSKQFGYQGPGRPTAGTRIKVLDAGVWSWDKAPPFARGAELV